ncbi:GNAT family N-acetyltransferase [Halobium palmae]|uniref:GNAT family N-acetyltransferase n=1 Tax=Halobium palmae TaxID=1776492 RepID=A0ABD5RY32_9EURY
MEVVPADTNDADALVDLWVELAEGQRAHGSHLLAAPNRASIREAVLQHVVTGGLFVARDPTIVGFVMFGPEVDGYEQDVTRGIVRNLFVAPERRGEGVGTALLDAAESSLRELGVDVVSLDVIAANEAARRFYRRHGYRPQRVELEKRVRDGESDTDSKEG